MGLLSIEAAATALGISRATMFRLVREGRVSTIKIGKRRKIKPEAIATILEKGM